MYISLISSLNKLRKERGSFLIEVLLAVAILSIGLTVIIQSYLSSLRASIYSQDYSLAGILLENKMTDLIQKGSIEDGIEEESNFEPPNERFRYKLTTKSLSDSAESDTVNINEALLDVSWGIDSKKKTMSAVTYIFDSQK